MILSWVVYTQISTYGRQRKENSEKVRNRHKNTPENGAFLCIRE